MATGDGLDDLIARCAAGESLALRSLYEKTSPQLFGLLRRILIRDDLAQEALQDVFVSVWRNADSYNPRKGAVFTWLVSIARYRAIDIKRSRAREQSLGQALRDDATQVADRTEPDASAETARDADAVRLKHCMKQLQPGQRDAVSVAYWRGLAHSEVAEYLGVPIGTVKSWIRRGLENLKRCMQHG